MNTEGRGANKMTTASVCWLPLFVIKILSGHSVTKSLSGILGSFFLLRQGQYDHKTKQLICKEKDIRQMYKTETKIRRAIIREKD